MKTSFVGTAVVCVASLAAAAGCGVKNQALVNRWEHPTGVAPGILAGPNEPAVVVAAEAAPERKRQVRAEFMNSSQIALYLKNGGKLAILPLGSMEVHGPHLPLATSTFINHATAILMAERMNAIVFPPIPYTAAPQSRAWPGTVDVPADETAEYVNAVVDALLDGGFKRVIILADDARFAAVENLVRGIQRRRGDVVLTARMDLLPSAGPNADQELLAKAEEIKKELGYEPADDIRVLAALKILGHPGAFDAGAAAAAGSPAGPESSFAAVLKKLRATGVSVAGAYAAPQESLPVRDCVKAADVDRAIAIMRREVRRCDVLPMLYDQYVREITGQIKSAPWAVKNYERTVGRCPGDKSRPARPGPVAPPVAERDTADVRIAAAAMPIEASPEHLRRYRAEFMSAADMAEHLRHNDIAILPVGAFEMHGPHGLLNTDSIQAHSSALLVAERWNAVVFPEIYYTYSGATEPWPGSVSVAPEVIVKYVKSVVEGLFDAGFKRVVLCWVHGPGGPAAREVVAQVWQERRQVVFNKSFRLLGGELMEKTLGYKSGEDAWSLAGVALLGHPGVFVVDEPQDAGQIKLPFHSMVDLLSAADCRPAWYMSYPTQHLAVRQCIKAADVPKLIAVMRENAKQFDDLPALMSEYLTEVEKLDDAAPWRPENWPGAFKDAAPAPPPGK